MSTFDEKVGLIHSLEAKIKFLENHREALQAEIAACSVACTAYQAERDCYREALDGIARYWWGPSRGIARAALEQGKRIQGEP